MLDKCKEDARRVIARRQLCSYMNQTKWRETIRTIKAEMPVPPPYQFQFLTSRARTGSERDYFCWGSWNDEGFPTDDYYFNIEWMRILAVCQMPGKQIDVREQLETILNCFQIPYEKENDIYTIYGYK